MVFADVGMSIIASLAVEYTIVGVVKSMSAKQIPVHISPVHFVKKTETSLAKITLRRLSQSGF